jgi:hypothetical protein
MNINEIMSHTVGIGCLLFWIAIAIGWIWSDVPEKKSKLRDGFYINSEIEEEDEE